MANGGQGHGQPVSETRGGQKSTAVGYCSPGLARQLKQIFGNHPFPGGFHASPDGQQGLQTFDISGSAGVVERGFSGSGPGVGIGTGRRQTTDDGRVGGPVEDGCAIEQMGRTFRIVKTSMNIGAAPQQIVHELKVHLARGKKSRLAGNEQIRRQLGQQGGQKPCGHVALGILGARGPRPLSIALRQGRGRER